MKLSELSEGWLNQTLAHLRGQISPDDIVNGAKFTLGDRGRVPQSTRNLLGNMDYLVVDARDDKARLIFIDRRTGELYDPGKNKMDISDLYDGDPEIKQQLAMKQHMPEIELARKQVLAGLLNSYNSKRIK